MCGLCKVFHGKCDKMNKDAGGRIGRLKHSIAR